MRDFYKKKLKNGATILFEKRDLPAVSFGIGVKQGFAYEKEREKGISHLTEHLIFKGTKKRSFKQITQEIEKKGGILNGFTDEETTAFWSKIPSKYFSKGAEIISDLMFNAKLNEKDFEKEKKVVFQELQMHKDIPEHYVIDKIKELMYKKPFGLSGIGTEKSLKNLRNKDILSFYRKRYSTNNMIFSAVGDTSLKEVENIAKMFPEKKGKIQKVNPSKISKHLVEKRQGINQAKLVLGFHIPKHKSQRYVYEVVNAFLTKGMSSKLFEEMREKRSLVYDVSGSLEIGKNFSHYLIYLGTTKDKIRKCKEIILKEMRNLKKLKEKDLEEVKEQLIGLRKIGSEESVNVMEKLISEEVLGDAREFYDYENKINKIKLKDIKKTKFNKYSSLALLPV